MNYEEIAKWSQIVSAVLFYAVMAWLWLKFIAPAVFAAQENKNRQIAEAERHRDEAKGALEALRADIEGAKRDSESIAQRAAEQAAREAQATIDETKAAGERALRNAQGELERSRVAARERFREELAEKALALARVEAERRVDGDTNTQLVNRFISALETGGAR